MAWIVLATLASFASIAFVVNEIRSAPEQDDDYEVHLCEKYRREAMKKKRASTEKRKPRRTDAA